MATNTDMMNALALRLPFPDGFDDLFRATSDSEDHHESAYVRACAYATQLGHTRVAWLWQQALEIGLRAGLGRYTEVARESTEFELGLKEGRKAGLKDGKQDGRKAGKLQGLKEGEVVGFEKGKAEGLGEGKRLGFVAGREFGEKQAMKARQVAASARIFVDVGTDSPAAELSPPSPAPHAPVPAVHHPLPIDSPHIPAIPTSPSPPLSWASLRIYAPGPTTHPLPTSRDVPVRSTTPPAVTSPSSAPFSWEDEANNIPLTNAPCTSARDLSVLRSDTTSLTPFGTLQYRARRTQNPSQPRRRFPSRPTPSRFARPFTTTTTTLDWDQDPRLSELSRVLRGMGWGRGGH
ncbi:hypothetical protein C8J57DRAFT_1361849 [Mycena rebaudengoi]|nr:hypothetical protein C8J57DRAFT_1361849 [Mycena rebaudengoi]